MDYYSLDHRQIQLDSEAIQRLMLAQSVESTTTTSSLATSPGQWDVNSNISRAKSPLSQAMLQIHSPNTVPDLNVGETVVLQMEEGRATLVTHPDNNPMKNSAKSSGSVDSGIVVNASKSTSGSESDDVFDKKEEKKTDLKTTQNLHNVISNLISAHTENLQRELEQSRNKTEQVVATTTSQDTVSVKKTTPEAVVTKQTPTILVSPAVNVSVQNKGGNSPGSRKSSLGSITVPRPSSAYSSGSTSSMGSPITVLAQPHVPERKRTKSVKVPHPAFNIPAASLEKKRGGGGVYNYNLPDRGLGSMMGTSPVPISLSPPAVARFPVTAVPPAVSAQVLNFVTPAWPMTRPASHSPASNDGSRNSGSPLDLSAVRQSASPSVVKAKDMAKEMPIQPKLRNVTEKSTAIQQHLQKQPEVVTPSSLVSPPNLSPKMVTQVATKKETEWQPSPGNSPPAAKAPYVQEMLYLFDKELEIVSVGKNKWIVRNEGELISMVKNNLSAKDVLSPVGNCVNGDTVHSSTESNKRSYDLENDHQKVKVTKLTNGDVHTDLNVLENGE